MPQELLLLVREKIAIQINLKINLISGSGAVGQSVAYHLIKNGWKDILILEQNKIKTESYHSSTGKVI